MPRQRTVSPRCVRMVKAHEGLRLEAYRCPAGVWTVGYGHTGPEVVPGLVIDQTQADAYLRSDLNRAGAAVNRLVTVSLAQGEFDALVSFTFNLGAGNLQSSTLLRKLNAGDRAGAVREFARWVKARDPNTGQLVTLPGLVRRRTEEAEMFASAPRPVQAEDTTPPIARDPASYAPEPVVDEHETVGQSGSVQASRVAAGAAVAGTAATEVADQAREALTWLDYAQMYGPWVILTVVVGAWLYIEHRRRRQIAEAKR